MGRLLAYLITTGLYISICAAWVSEHGNHKDSVGKYQLKSGSDEESNESGEADDVPYREQPEQRPLQSGDIFTAPELLPLAKRLISKVDTRKPGEGTGIVSSARSPAILADNLYHSFFVRDRSIMVLTKYDISGLDALQALALDGEGIHNNLKLISVKGGRCYVDKLDKYGVVDNNMCYPNGPGPRKSIYKLLTKPNDNVNSIPNNRKKREAAEVPQSRIALMKKLQKNRQLVVNSGRKHKNNKAESKNGKINKGENTHSKNAQGNAVTSQPPEKVPASKNAKLKGCQWKFECINPRDLDTCRLKTFCPSKGETGYNGKNPEQEKALQRVRRMIGISSIDEEVEKIMEARALFLRMARSNTRYHVEEL